MIIQNLPKPIQKPYIRSDRQESKAMTIVLGFKCEGGIVLCADQQISAPDAFKYHERKITAVESGVCKVIFGYSGLPSLAREAQEKITKGLHDAGTRINGELVHSITDDVLTNMGRHYTDIQLQLLIATCVWLEQPELLKFDGKGLHKADDFNYLGIGDSSLIRYLAKTHYSETLDIDAGLNLGIYLVRKAEQHIDHCGGPIDITYLADWDDSCTFMPEEEVEKRVKEMEKQERLLTNLLFSETSPI
jgi:20S proteasome alpha/beta subunit